MFSNPSKSIANTLLAGLSHFMLLIGDSNSERVWPSIVSSSLLSKTSWL